MTTRTIDIRYLGIPAVTEAFKLLARLIGLNPIYDAGDRNGSVWCCYFCEADFGVDDQPLPNVIHNPDCLWRQAATFAGRYP